MFAETVTEPDEVRVLLVLIAAYVVEARRIAVRVSEVRAMQIFLFMGITYIEY
jgi:hypothetical protein